MSRSSRARPARDGVQLGGSERPAERGDQFAAERAGVVARSAGMAAPAPGEVAGRVAWRPPSASSAASRAAPSPRRSGDASAQQRIGNPRERRHDDDRPLGRARPDDADEPTDRRRVGDRGPTEFGDDHNGRSRRRSLVLPPRAAPRSGSPDPPRPGGIVPQDHDPEVEDGACRGCGRRSPSCRRRGRGRAGVAGGRPACPPRSAVRRRRKVGDTRVARNPAAPARACSGVTFPPKPTDTVLHVAVDTGTRLVCALSVKSAGSIAAGTERAEDLPGFPLDLFFFAAMNGITLPRMSSDGDAGVARARDRLHRRDEELLHAERPVQGRQRQRERRREQLGLVRIAPDQPRAARWRSISPRWSSVRLGDQQRDVRRPSGGSACSSPRTRRPARTPARSAPPPGRRARENTIGAGSGGATAGDDETGDPVRQRRRSRASAPRRHTGFPALADDAASAASSNHGWSARSRTNFWPTVPVAPRTQTGICALMRRLACKEIGGQAHVELDAAREDRPSGCARGRCARPGSCPGRADIPRPRRGGAAGRWRSSRPWSPNPAARCRLYRTAARPERSSGDARREQLRGSPP